MTKKSFEIGDVIGSYTIDEFGGTNENGESFWWTTEDGKPRLVSEKKLRLELRRAELTPEIILNLSSKAYDALRREIGETGIEAVLNTSKPKTDALKNVNQREIATKWFAWHPQVPRTRENTTLFDNYLAKMASPTFTSRDFDRAFTDLFFDLELNPKAAGVEGFGEGIRGTAAINKLSSTQIKQLQKSFPVVNPVDYSKLSLEKTIEEVGKLPLSADQFLKWTKDFDKERGISQPVSPLLVADRERIWSVFFQVHPTLVVTEELKTRLLDLLRAGSKFNPSNESLPVLNQYLDTALDFLIKAGEEVKIFLEPNTHSAGNTHWQMNAPRPSTPAPSFDDTPVEVTVNEINAMPAEEYGRRLLNPNFKAAVDARIHRVG